MDNRYVDLKISKIYPDAGEGSFAKTRVAKHTTYSLYSGKFYTDKEFGLYMLKANQDFSNRNVKLSDQEHEDFWKYRYNTENQQV